MACDSALAADGAAGLQGSAPGAWLGSHSAVGGDDAGLKGTQQGCLKDADAWTGWTFYDILYDIL